MSKEYNIQLDKGKNSVLNLDRGRLVDFKRAWEDGWICNKLKSNLILDMLRRADFGFSDFVIVYLFIEILFSRIGKSNVKYIVNDLREIITITKKEEDELVNGGLKNAKLRKKIYKRIMKVYKESINKKYGVIIPSSKTASFTGRDFLTIYLDAILDKNSSDDMISEEMNEAINRESSVVFVYDYLVAIYMNYEGALKFTNIYGDIISGELKSKIQERLLSELCFFFTIVTKSDIDARNVLSDSMMDVAIAMVEAESMQLQNDKSFYSNRYLMSKREVALLQEENKALKEELLLFRELFKNRLKNKKILIIGDRKKEQEYEEVINSFGGSMSIYDSFNDFSKMSNKTLDGYDCIVLFTYYTSHSVSDKLDKYSEKVIHVNSSSKVELEKALLSKY